MALAENILYCPYQLKKKKKKNYQENGTLMPGTQLRPMYFCSHCGAPQINTETIHDPKNI